MVQSKFERSAATAPQVKMAKEDSKYEHIFQHGGMVTVLRSHGLSTANQSGELGLSSSVPPSRAELAEKAAIVANTRRDADATAATTKAVAAVINPDAAVAITMAAALAAAARATARGAAAREAAAPRLPGAAAAAAAAAVPTRAAAAVPTRAAAVAVPTRAAAVASAAPTYSRNLSSGVGSVGAPSTEPDGFVPRLSSDVGSVGAPSAEPSGFVPRRIIGRACSFERKVGHQRRGDGNSVLQRTVSFGRKASRSSGSGEGGQTGPLQLVPSVRHTPLLHPLSCYIPIGCSLWTALPPQPCYPATAASVASLLEPGLP